MYAKVVVDIPDLKHEGFDYEIPEHLENSVKIGCRVLVPIGPRVTLGFVIAITNETNLEKVKPIKKNLDIIPSLNDELIKLGKWMSYYYSSHLFRTLQMLLPAALKTKQEEYIFVNEEWQDELSPNEQKLFDWILKKQPIPLATLLKQFNQKEELIFQMIEQNILRIKKQHKDKGKKRTVKYVKSLLTKDKLLMELASIPKSAKKQKEIIDLFIQAELQEIELSELMKQLSTSASSVNSLVKKNILQIMDKEIYRNPYKNREFSDKKVELTNEQEQVLSRVLAALNAGQAAYFLLHGVTGSGKTEIYLNAIEHALKQNKDAIMLVPEIALTPQMVERFKGRFSSAVAVLHSRLSQGEKLDEWRRIQQGEAKIAIGARSAIFAPFRNLGLTIIDEEHEGSYKQEEHPKYHVRDIARRRSQNNSSVMILGSATPSMESYYQSLSKKYQLIELPKRVKGSQLPKIHLIDMRDELRLGNRSMFSAVLQEKIAEKLEKKEQIVLFLNRRGYSTFVMCRSCGFVIKCPHCDISLTYHHTNHAMRCHYCGYAQHIPNTCPECGSSHIRYFGTGTQRVEEEIGKNFPGARVIRMDVDTTSKKGAHEKLLNSFKRYEGDILLGTQMIAKGLDFPKVTLVGVIAADTMLKIPDFRSAERTFQLLTQVSGRAGRHELSGEVVIQTYSPEHYSIQLASQHDYHSFFRHELGQREKMSYPPYKRMTLVLFSHPDMMKVMKASEYFTRAFKKDIPSDVEVLGPVSSPIARLKDRYRFQCMIKYNNELSVIKKLKETMESVNEKLNDRNLLISIDIDPYVLM